MYTDITRDSYEADRNISGVLFQQGRPECDADLNEALRILHEALRASHRDLYGPFAGPDPNFGGICGFEIVGAADAQFKGDFLIRPGRYCVGGLIINAGRSFERPWRYSEQPDWRPKELEKVGSYLVYLDVWERHELPFGIAGLPDPALSSLDLTHRSRVVWQVKAIGVTDAPGLMVEDNKITMNGVVYGSEETESVMALEPLADVLGFPPAWKPNDTNRRRPSGELRVHFGAPASLNPMPEDAQPSSYYAQSNLFRLGNVEEEALPFGYYGQSNQLYRIEIHEAEWKDENELTKLTFKWSRNNGSIVFRIPDGIPNNKNPLELVLESSPNAGFQDLLVGSRVELLDKPYLDLHPWKKVPGSPEPAETVRPLFEITEVIEDDLFCRVSLKYDKEKEPLPISTTPNGEPSAFLRTWDHLEETITYRVPDKATPKIIAQADNLKLVNGAVSLANKPLKGLRIILELGVAIEFRGSGAEGELRPGDFQPGDHWIISARTGWLENGCRSKPGDPPWQSPRRIEHHFAPLAVVEVEDGKVKRLQDMRLVVTPNINELNNKPKGAAVDDVEQTGPADGAAAPAGGGVAEAPAGGGAVEAAGAAVN
jgi:hypothetical protein